MNKLEAPKNLLLDVGEQEWMLWQHQPITAAYLKFLDDQVLLWRELAADLLEAGAFRLGDANEDRNPDVVRGKMLALRTLRGITLQDIQGFYGKAEPSEAEEDQAR